MKSIFKLKTLALLFVGLVVSVSCENELDLPEAGSLEDITPPEANFAAAVDPNNFDVYNFANLSTSATTYAWDFGDGNTSTDLDAQNQYAAEGVYTITLLASDALGATSTFSADIEVIEPEVSAAIIPVINSESFEPSDEACTEGGADGKACWNEGPGDTIQITGSSSRIRTGSKAAKFTSSSQDRVAYQDQIAVTPNTDYTLEFWYIIEEEQVAAGPTSFTAWIIPEGSYADTDALVAANIGEVVGATQNTTYERGTLVFNTGANTTIGIAFSSTGNDEVYADDFSLEPVL